MMQADQKTVSGKVLMISGVLAGLVLAAGLVSYLLGMDWIGERSGAMLCLYSGALLAFMAAVYVTDRLWRAQVIVDMLSALGLPAAAEAKPLAGRVYQAVLTVLLWAVLAAASLLPDNAVLAVAVIPMLIVWLAFVRVMAKARVVASREDSSAAGRRACRCGNGRKAQPGLLGSMAVFHAGSSL